MAAKQETRWFFSVLGTSHGRSGHLYRGEEANVRARHLATQPATDTAPSKRKRGEDASRSVGRTEDDVLAIETPCFFCHTVRASLPAIAWNQLPAELPKEYVVSLADCLNSLEAIGKMGGVKQFAQLPSDGIVIASLCGGYQPSTGDPPTSGGINITALEGEESGFRKLKKGQKQPGHKKDAPVRESEKSWTAPSTRKSAVAVDGPGGRKWVNTALFVDMVDRVGADVVVAMSVEGVLTGVEKKPDTDTTLHEASKKKTVSSSSAQASSVLPCTTSDPAPSTKLEKPNKDDQSIRTLSYLTEIFKLRPEWKLDNSLFPGPSDLKDGDLVTCSTGGVLFLASAAGRMVEGRVECAQKGLSCGAGGIALTSLGVGESPQARKEVIHSVLNPLPKNVLRFTYGVGAAKEVIAAVRAGVDIFICSYPSDMAEKGHAIIILEGHGEGESIKEDESRKRRKSEKKVDDVEMTEQSSNSLEAIDLFDNINAVDSRPLQRNCSCFTCTHHTRSYIHHLLQTHEILARVLLELHNYHCYSVFFKLLRAALRQGSVDELTNLIH